MVGNVGMEEAVMRQISYALKPSLTNVTTFEFFVSSFYYSILD
jgi:hypothetical protein